MLEALWGPGGRPGLEGGSAAQGYVIKDGCVPASRACSWSGLLSYSYFGLLDSCSIIDCYSYIR